jgi:hypothetical protein
MPNFSKTYNFFLSILDTREIYVKLFTNVIKLFTNSKQTAIEGGFSAGGGA